MSCRLLAFISKAEVFSFLLFCYKVRGIIIHIYRDLHIWVFFRWLLLVLSSLPFWLNMILSGCRDVRGQFSALFFIADLNFLISFYSHILKSRGLRQTHSPVFGCCSQPSDFLPSSHSLLCSSAKRTLWCIHNNSCSRPSPILEDSRSLKHTDTLLLQSPVTNHRSVKMSLNDTQSILSSGCSKF